MNLTHQGHQFLRQSYLILATVDNAKRSLQLGTERLPGKLTRRSDQSGRRLLPRRSYQAI